LVLRHSFTGRRAVVPMHGGRDLRSAVVHAILADAGLTVDEFLNLLRQRVRATAAASGLIACLCPLAIAPPVSASLPLADPTARPAWQRCASCPDRGTCCSSRGAPSPTCRARSPTRGDAAHPAQGSSGTCSARGTASTCSGNAERRGRESSASSKGVGAARHGTSGRRPLRGTPCTSHRRRRRWRHERRATRRRAGSPSARYGGRRRSLRGQGGSARGRAAPSRSSRGTDYSRCAHWSCAGRDRALCQRPGTSQRVGPHGANLYQSIGFR